MTKIICGFAGIGKTTTTKNNKYPQYKFLDLDSSQFDKAGFPANYLEMIDIHVTQGVYDFILVSTHPDVIKGLIEKDYGDGVVHLVYPEYKHDKRHAEWSSRENAALKEMFLERYKNHGSSPEFIEMMDRNFWSFVLGLENVPVTVMHHRCNQILDDLDFFVWRILGLGRGLETNLVLNWEGWDEDGHTKIFYNSVLNPAGWGPHYYSMMHQKKDNELFVVSIDTESGVVTVDDRENELSYNYTFEINLKKI